MLVFLVLPSPLANAMHPVGNLRLVDDLVEAGLISVELSEATLSQHQLLGGRIEDALIDVGAIEEGELLKYLAGRHRTRYVSTEKLSKADIEPATLELVPHRFAEQQCVFPVLYDRDKQELSVVTPVPDDASMLQQLKMLPHISSLKLIVARPAAVKAAVSKAYLGDIHAFALLDRQAHQQFTNMLDVYERNLVSEESMAVALTEEGPKERVLSSDDLQRGDQHARHATGGGSAVGESYLETLNVLISLLENGRGDLRGHSSQVARLVGKLCERIRVPESQRAASCAAAYIHDLGKAGKHHLTPLNVAQYPGHLQVAKKAYLAPLHLLESVNLGKLTRDALENMYERFDGQGLPGNLKGKDIPLGARVLAIADTYSDLTQNARNPFRRVLEPAQACEVLVRYASSVFDPNLVDLFRHTITGDDLKARLLATRRHALVIDPDPEETTVLELRLIEQGFEVSLARSAPEALLALQHAPIEIVVSELDLGSGDVSEGLRLLTEARREDWGAHPAWVFLTSHGGRGEAQRAFDEGAADYMAKPVNADLLVAKLRQILERDARRSGARGVAGSLQEMGLPDIIQVLWHGKKSGSLKIKSGKDKGEIHFVDGAIHNALWSTLRGEEAFYAMLRIQDGDFVLDPNVIAEQAVINASPEALLLEGMRRLDEAAVNA